MAQSELEMEKQLVEQLANSGYEVLDATNESAIVDNFRQQLGYHNRRELNELPLSNDEFEQVLSQLRKGTIFDKSMRLRHRVMVNRSDGTVVNLELFNSRHWCQNHFQVTRQITNNGDTSNTRYDVTILINGLPLIQIELKRRGLDLKSAFDQIVRYRKTSYSQNAGLFDYIQLYVISNGVNTRYFSTNNKLNYQFTFPWTDEDNKPINRLSDFADTFLEKCHVSKMIARYIVHHQSRKTVLVLRPYQYYAVEAMINRVEIGRGDGYIWHTTGSGKTLTSFKASQIISGMKEVDKVLFVVDRRDLDYQTAQEFNAFSEGSVDSTDNTRKLVEQLNDPGCKLIVTTIQKLNTAINQRRYQTKLKSLRDKRVVFNFDECHRSQFGDTHQRICDFFNQRQMFGFTGTPIFEENAIKTRVGMKTTNHLFGACLHKYIITDAIKDGNVLRFSVDYRKVKAVFDGTEVEAKNRKLLNDKHYLSSEKRIQKVVNDVLSVHDNKTHERSYTAMMCVNSVDELMTYYRLIKASQEGAESPLRIATIFSCNGNDNKEFDGVSETDGLEVKVGADDSRMNFLLDCVKDYNRDHGTSYDVHDSQDFYRYYQDISKRVRKQDIDILLVVNMFLTGFDSPTLNTLYVDKNLRHQGLIQAYSRTNRVFDVRKSHGNIVCYRDLKEATDEALMLFANRHSKGGDLEDVASVVIMSPYPDLKKQFNDKIKQLKEQTPTPDAVDDLVREEEQLQFLQTFREVIRMKNALKTFPDYDDDLKAGKLEINEDDLVDFESKYKDKYNDIQRAEKEERDKKAKERREEIEKLRKEGKLTEAEQKEREHQLEIEAQMKSMQFDIELLDTAEINVEYILNLIERLDGEDDDFEFMRIRTMILDTLERNSELKDKAGLFTAFIDEEIKPNAKLFKKDELGDIHTRFEQFADNKRQVEIEALANEYGLDVSIVKSLVDDYLYSGKEPTKGDLMNLLKASFPKPIERHRASKLIIQSISSFI